MEEILCDYFFKNKDVLFFNSSNSVTYILLNNSNIFFGTMGLIYQSDVETSADPCAQINLRQSSRVIYETFVCRQSHRTKDRTLINVAE